MNKIKEEVRKCQECRFFTSMDVENCGTGGPCFDFCGLGRKILFDSSVVPEDCLLRNGKVVIEMVYVGDR